MANLEIKHISESKLKEFLSDFDTQVGGINKGKTKYFNNLYTVENRSSVFYFGQKVFEADDTFQLVELPGGSPERKEAIQLEADAALYKAGYIPKKSSFDWKEFTVFKDAANTDKNSLRYVCAVPKATVLAKWSPKLKFENAVKKKTAAPQTNTSSSKNVGISGTPNKTNIGITDPSGKYHSLEIILGEIDLYTSVASNIFNLFQQRINMYDIQFDKPFSAEELSMKIRGLQGAVKVFLPSEIPNNTKIKLIFSEDFRVLEEMWYQEEGNSQISWIKAYDINESEEFLLRNVPLLNSLTFNLVKIYNKYSNTFTNYDSQSKLFKTEDHVEKFLRTYLRPELFILNTTVTRDILNKLDNSKYSSKYVLDKFILGDNRLLDDEFYEAYRVTRDEIKDGAFKAELQQQVAQQYEKVGDFLGDKYFRGEFREITSMEEFYDDLVNYIDITELIILSAKCLLKVLPLKDMLDAICDPVLEEWDEHKEKIIQELESMDDGIAKDLAADLKDLYFSVIEETATDFLKKEVTAENVMKWTGDSLDWVGGTLKWWSPNEWSEKEKIINLVVKNKKSITSKINILVGSEKAVINQMISNKSKYNNLLQEQEKLNSQLKVFGSNPAGYPENFKRQLEYYKNKIDKVNTRAVELKAIYSNLCDQLKIQVLLCASYDFDALRARSVDKVKKQAINIFLDGSAEYDIPKFIPPVTTITDSIIPNLIVINPYMSGEQQKKNLLKQIGVKGDPLGSSKLLALGNITEKLQFTQPSEIQHTKGNGLGSQDNFKFVFGNDIQQASVKDFDQNLKNIETLVRTIAHLNSAELKGSPFNNEVSLQKISNFGKDTAQEALNQIFGDEGSRYYLCLAIIAAIPGAGYLAYQLINDHEAVADYFRNQGKNIWKGLKRRWQMFANTDYYTMDILKALLDQLIQVGINLARDLILNGIMAVLGRLTEVCGDEEMVNAPYNPIGAIDLSSFMIASKKNPTSDLEVGSIEDTESFSRIITIDPGITGAQFQIILDNLSDEFTIREMAQLLDNSAPNNYYTRALNVLQSVTFLTTPDETPFYIFYVKPGIFGIKQFFALLAKDIEPAYIAQALVNFEKEKALLLEICFGRDDSVLEQLLCKDLPPDECLKALAAKAEMPKSLAKDLVKSMGNLFDQNIIPDPCADGKGLYDESQKFGAKKIGESIFGSIEQVFESDISKIRDIYLGSADILKNNTILSSAQMKQMANGANSTDNDVKEKAMAMFEKSRPPNPDLVAPQILQSFRDSMEHTGGEDDTFISSNFTYYDGPGASDEGEDKDGDGILDAPDLLNDAYPDAVKTINISFQAAKKSIELLFDSSTDVIQDTSWNTQLTTDIELPPSIEGSDGEEVIETKILSSHRYIHLSASGGWNIKNINPGTEDKYFMVRPPDNLLFGVTTDDENKDLGGLSFQAWSNTDNNNADSYTREWIGKYAIQHKFYEKLFISILKDLLAFSLKEGLYRKDKFLNINFNKCLDIAQNCCFFGFMNKNVLNNNMQRLADRLACYNPNDPAITPVNVAMIKYTLDCVIRIIVIKEMMKSLFVYGIFPQELEHIGDESDTLSLYSNIIIAEIKHYIPIIISAKDATKNYESFYNEVIKKFITDMMKIIYQDDTLSDEEAFKRVIQTQFLFVRQLFHDIVLDAIAVSDENDNPILPPSTEYELIKSTLEGGKSDSYDTLKMLDIRHRMESLQNDVFTAYMGSYSKISDGQGLASITNVNWNQLEDTVPIFERSARVIEFIDYKTLQPSWTSSVHTALQGNDDGIVLEKFIEFDYQVKFFEDGPAEINLSRLTKFRKFLRDLGKIPIIQEVEMWGSTWRMGDLLKNMLYETKLIMFFPQLKFIIDSLHTDYVGGDVALVPWAKFAGPVVGLGRLGNLFDAFFYYNFLMDKTMEVSPTVDLLAKVFNTKSLQDEIAWALCGKMYLSDVKNLIESFSYPIWGEDWEVYKDGSEPLGYDNIFSGLGAYTYGKSVTEVLKPPGAKAAGEPNVFESYSIDSLKSQANVDMHDFELNSLRLIAYAAKHKLGSPLKGIHELLGTPWDDFSADNFFTHLFKRDLGNIIQIKPCLRLSAYTNAREDNWDEWWESFKDIVEGKPNPDMIMARAEIQKSLLREKAGPLTVGDRRYICTPLYTSSKELPTNYSTWYLMFMRINKDLCLSLEDYFKKLSEMPKPLEENFNIFDMLSTEGSGKDLQAPDIFNFVYSFDFVTALIAADTNTTWTNAFKSTQWFNIRGNSVSKEEILRHVALGEDTAKQAGQYLRGYDWGNEGWSGINFHLATGLNEDKYIPETFGSPSPFVYLNDPSLASLTENSLWFLNEDESDLKLAFKSAAAAGPDKLLTEYNAIFAANTGKDPWVWGPKSAGQRGRNFNPETKVIGQGGDENIGGVVTLADVIDGNYTAGAIYKEGDDNGKSHFSWHKSIDRWGTWMTDAGAKNHQQNILKHHGSGPGNTWLKLDETWDITNSQGEVILKDAPKYIAIRAYYVLPEYDGATDAYFVWIDHGYWEYKFPKEEDSWSLYYDAKYPGSKFYRSDADFEPDWFSKSNYRAPHSDVTWTMWQANLIQQLYGLDWVEEDGAEVTWPAPMRGDPKEHGKGHVGHDGGASSMTIWRPGYVEGGLQTATKVPQKTELEGDLGLPNAYDIFQGMLTGVEKAQFNDFLKAFFIREQTTMVAVMNKLLAEKYYPQIETAFEGSLNVAFNALSTAVASANGDWQYTAGKSDNEFQLDFESIGIQILKMFLGGMANMVDPLWRTDWWQPGPFTPIGIAAKLLDERKPDDDDTKESSYVPGIPGHCEEAYQDQVNLINALMKSQVTPPSSQPSSPSGQSTPSGTAKKKKAGKKKAGKKKKYTGKKKKKKGTT